VRALFDEVRARFGGLDLLFNNAGIGVFGLFTGSKPEDWRRMIDANIYGALNCTRAHPADELTARRDDLFGVEHRRPIRC
jgi:NAD(P)-dependent dehydrogenase (short-subunit alcohol dehydrogenase family)